MPPAQFGAVAELLPRLGLLELPFAGLRNVSVAVTSLLGGTTALSELDLARTTDSALCVRLGRSLFSLGRRSKEASAPCTGERPSGGVRPRDDCGERFAGLMTELSWASRLLLAVGALPRPA